MHVVIQTLLEDTATQIVRLTHSYLPDCLAEFIIADMCLAGGL